MSQKMKIANGLALRAAFYDKDLKTIQQVADALHVSTRTASKLFNDQNVDQLTVIKAARFLGVEPESLIAVHPTN